MTQPVMDRPKTALVNRLAWLLWASWLASACVAPAARPTSPVPIWVVDDGNHNGIVMPAEDAPFKPAGTAAGSFVEYGFSDRRWMREGTLSAGRIWELIVGQNEGVIVLRVHECIDDATRERMPRKILARREDFARLSDELWGWVRRDGRVEEHQGAPPTFVIESTHAYSLLNNCRVFTARLLQQLGDSEQP